MLLGITVTKRKVWGEMPLKSSHVYCKCIIMV
jgi:hypothetical protein